MKCVILQPSYIPWRGFFDQIRQADVFVFYDDVQYDKHGWRNRNQIKTPTGKQWLTIPVSAKGAVTEHVAINEVPIIWSKAWNKEHLRTIRQHYGKAPHFKAYEPLLDEFYERKDTLLADFTIDFTIALARALHIEHTQFVRSSTMGIGGKKTDRVIAVLQSVGADHYISGPSAKDYIETEKFDAAGIRLDYVEYDYPEYPQLYPPYDPAISILDLLFMTGDKALSYISGRR
jgi:WbqC-like protein family